MTQENQCPLCKEPRNYNPRYPMALCLSCEKRAEDASGRRLVFLNTSIGGGCQGYYVDDQSLYPSLRCFVDGKLCQAGELRFGGTYIALLGSS